MRISNYQIRRRQGSKCPDKLRSSLWTGLTTFRGSHNFPFQSGNLYGNISAVYSGFGRTFPWHRSKFLDIRFQFCFTEKVIRVATVIRLKDWLIAEADHLGLSRSASTAIIVREREKGVRWRRGRGRRRREEEKERAEEGEEDRPKRRRGRDAHINTCATQTKTLQRTALVADTILRHADTSILISPSGLSPRKRRPFVVYPSMKYICVYPRTSGTRRNDSIWSRSRGFTSVSRGATGSSRSRITLRNEGRERKRGSIAVLLRVRRIHMVDE